MTADGCTIRGFPAVYVPAGMAFLRGAPVRLSLPRPAATFDRFASGRKGTQLNGAAGDVAGPGRAQALPGLPLSGWKTCALGPLRGEPNGLIHRVRRHTRESVARPGAEHDTKKTPVGQACAMKHSLLGAAVRCAWYRNGEAGDRRQDVIQELRPVKAEPAKLDAPPGTRVLTRSDCAMASRVSSEKACVE